MTDNLIVTRRDKSGLLLNADREQSRQVWQSFGIAMVSMPFLTTHEQLALQLLNQFLYKIAVSRVQVTFEITDYYSIT